MEAYQPGVVRVIDRDQSDDGRPFFVMELIEGGSLADAIGGRALAPDRVLALGIQIAEGLEAAHTKGILHRDVKPANVLVTTRGTPKVLDFGLAKPIPVTDS